MASSFFRALNPHSEYSGVTYCKLKKQRYVSEFRLADEISFQNPDEASPLVLKKSTDDKKEKKAYFTSNYPCYGQLMIDATVDKNIKRYLDQDLNLIEAIHATFEIILGEHYDRHLKNLNNPFGGAKGVLDFTILPLLARKLWADTNLEQRKGLSIANLISWAIAIPIEVARVSVAGLLTGALLPVITLVHLLKPFFHSEKVEDDFEVLPNSCASGNAL